MRTEYLLIALNFINCIMMQARFAKFWFMLAVTHKNFFTFTLRIANFSFTYFASRNRKKCLYRIHYCAMKIETKLWLAFILFNFWFSRCNLRFLFSQCILHYFRHPPHSLLIDCLPTKNVIHQLFIIFLNEFLISTKANIIFDCFFAHV